MVLRAVVLTAAVVVLAAIVYTLGPARIAALIGASGWTFAWMILLYGVHIAIRAVVLWRSLPSGTLSLRDVVRIRFAAEAVEMLTFTGPFLAEPAKGWMFVSRGISVADTAVVIAFEYLIYTLIAADIALASLGVLVHRNAFSPAVRGPILALMVCLALFTAGVLFAATTGIGLLEPSVRFARPLLGSRRTAIVAARVRAAETPLLALLHGRPWRVVEAMAAEFITHGLLVLEVWLLFRSLGLRAGPAVPWIVEGGVKFINAAFFFVPGQIGAAEGVNALIVRALGYAPAVGVALSLMRRARAAVVAVIGAIAAPAFKRPDSQLA
ncbi:MAG TPA: lysylphosphatidylglycerol synthase domain-containing protein [Vicinamibacterales bacterium]|jgi:lysylphosphatidylglycerol synthase-like protein|nr:lysylphosphatidylglycerol synthase domain-containing protein [Vicinamibacterales bacterium]